MDWLEPFLPDLTLTPDHNLADIEAELAFSSRLQSLLKGFFRFEVSVDYLEDFLAQNGINPHEFWDVVDANIDAIIARDQPLENADSILVMPDGSPIPAIYGRDGMEPRPARCLTINLSFPG